MERIVQGARGQRGTDEQCGGLVEDGGSSRELQPNGAPGRKNVQGGVVLFIKAQPAGRLSLPGPSAVLVKQLKAGSCHAE